MSNTSSKASPDLMASIRTKIDKATESDERTAMFHFQVFLHAPELESVNATAFCKSLGMTETFKTEFRKMLNLRRMLAKQGYKLEADA